MKDVVIGFNVCETTIRRATNDGSLFCLTLPSGHRRFREQDVLAWLGYADEKGFGPTDQIPIAAVIRVSSTNQSRKVGSSEKSSLDHQRERVTEFIQDKWGDQANVTLYSSVGSGMNFERREFLMLIQDVLAGKYRGGFLVATDFTRVCRFGIKLVEWIAEQGNCQIIYTLDDEAKSLNESLSDEILSILTHYTAKISGAKNKAINGVKVPEDTLKDIFSWYKSGMTVRAIAARLKKEGRHKDEKQRTISSTVIHKRLKENWKALEAMDIELDKNSFVKFADSCVRDTGNNQDRLKRTVMIEAYSKFCQAQKMSELSTIKVAREIKKLGWTKKIDRTSRACYWGQILVPDGSGS